MECCHDKNADQNRWKSDHDLFKTKWKRLRWVQLNLNFFKFSSNIHRSKEKNWKFMTASPTSEEVFELYAMCVSERD